MQHNPTDIGIHDHSFHVSNKAAEKGTFSVMWISALMMIVEIFAGWWYNSMALLADGWHMSSHTLAIGLSAFAYAQARKYAKDPKFAFGTWKIEVLAGFASALFLMGVAAMMIYGSLERLLSPQAIYYQEAIWIALIGLTVNLICALILGHAHGEHHGHNHASTHHHKHGQHDHQVHDHHSHDHHSHDHHSHDHHNEKVGVSTSTPKVKHHDLNLRSAYIHVIADAATSVLAVVALLGGMYYGWSWLDPLMGIVGAVLVGIWSKNLILDTGTALLDREMDAPVVNRVRDKMVSIPLTVVTDLHMWRVGGTAYSCVIALATQDTTLNPVKVKDHLKDLHEIVHITVEIHHH